MFMQDDGNLLQQVDLTTFSHIIQTHQIKNKLHIHPWPKELRKSHWTLE